MILAILHRFRKWLYMIAVAANMIGTLVLFALVAIMNTDVIARGVFNAPLRGVVEVVIFSLVLIVYLQLPDVVRSNRLTRSDGFLTLIKVRRPGLSMAVTRFIDAVSGVFMGLIAWTVWPEFAEAFESCYFFTPPEFGPPPSGDFFADLSAAFGRCDYFGTPGILKAPWWPAKLAIFFGVFMCAVIFTLKALIGYREPESTLFTTDRS